MSTHHRAGSGEPLVLIHGFANIWRVWEPVLPALEERFDVLAGTLAGHHDGVPLDEGVEATVDALADAIERQMDDAGFETAHIAGNSLGGWLALELARRGRARSVICLAPAGGWGRGSSAERRLRRLFTFGYRFVSFLEPRAQNLLKRPGFRKMVMRQAMEHGDRLTPQQVLDRLRGSLGCSIYFELMETLMRDGPPTWLGEVGTPVLVAWPEHDRILLEKSCSAGFDALPNAERVVLPGVGHVPMADDPELVARTITEFAERHSAPVSEAAATAAGP